MSLSNTTAPSPEQDLLDALIELRRLLELRQLDHAGVFGNSKRFRAYMLDLNPRLPLPLPVLSRFCIKCSK